MSTRRETFMNVATLKTILSTERLWTHNVLVQHTSMHCYAPIQEWDGPLLAAVAHVAVHNVQMASANPKSNGHCKGAVARAWFRAS